MVDKEGKYVSKVKFIYHGWSSPSPKADLAKRLDSCINIRPEHQDFEVGVNHLMGGQCNLLSGQYPSHKLTHTVTFALRWKVHPLPILDHLSPVELETDHLSPGLRRQTAVHHSWDYLGC